MCVRPPLLISTNLSQVIYSMIKHNYPSRLRRQCPPPQGTMGWCVSHAPLCQIPDGTPYWGVGRFLDQPFSQYSITTISVTQHEGRIPYHPFCGKRLLESILRFNKADIGGTWWILLRHFMLAFPLNCPPIYTKS